MTIIEKEVLNLIDNSDTRCALAITLRRSEMQVRRYIKDNDIILTTYDALQIIKKATGKRLGEIITRKKQEIIVSDGQEEVEHITES
jgi:ribosomal protein L14